MRKIMIQFHATPDELIDYLNSISSEFNLIMIMMVLRPFTMKVIENELSLDMLSLDNDIRIILTKERPNMDTSSPNKFYDLNPGTINLDVGRLDSIGLQESALSFMSDEKGKIVIADKLAAKLKKITKAGAVVVNPVTGAEANARSHRYTQGAKSKYDQGIRILPIAGNCIFKLSD